jgi:tetratricopeptide (TPR) repeat protein
MRVRKYLLAVSVVVLAGITGQPVWAHGSFHENLDLLTKQIKQEPRNADLYLERGELHRLHGDVKAALSDYNRALRFDGELSQVFFARAMLQLEQGSPDKAIGDVSQFLARNPGHGQGLFLRGQILCELDRISEAVAVMDIAIISMDVPKPEHFVTRARVIHDMADGSIAEAIDGLDRGMELLGPVASMQLEAGHLESARGEFDRAIERLDTLSDQYARKDLLLVRRGQVHEAAGSRMEAESLYTEALEVILALPAHKRNADRTRELETLVREKLAVNEEGLR